jgi:MFS family permease
MPERRLDRNVVTLGVVSLLNDASSEMIFPLLPAFLTTVIGAGPAVLGAIEGTADSLSSLLRLPAGWLSDRMRRKPLVVGGYALANLARPLVAAATAPWHVLAIRLLDRVGKGLRAAPRDALLADSVPPGDRGRAFGFHRSMDHVGAVVGPLLASLTFAALGRSYRLLFLLASLPGFAAVLWAGRVVETPRGRRTDPAVSVPASPEMRARLDPLFVVLIVAMLLFGLGNSSDAFLLLGLAQTGMDPVALPVLWAAFHVVKVASAYPLGRLSDSVGRMPILLTGWAYYAIAYAAFAVTDGPAALAAIFVAYGLFYGLTEGVERALVSDLVAPPQRGVAFGLYNAAVGVTALPASLITGLVWEAHGRAAALGFGAGMAMLGALVLIGGRLALGRR